MKDVDRRCKRCDGQEGRKKRPDFSLKFEHRKAGSTDSFLYYFNKTKTKQWCLGGLIWRKSWRKEERYKERENSEQQATVQRTKPKDEGCKVERARKRRIERRVTTDLEGEF